MPFEKSNKSTSPNRWIEIKENLIRILSISLIGKWEEFIYSPLPFFLLFFQAQKYYIFFYQKNSAHIYLFIIISCPHQIYCNSSYLSSDFCAILPFPLRRIASVVSNQRAVLCNWGETRHFFPMLCKNLSPPANVSFNDS